MMIMAIYAVKQLLTMYALHKYLQQLPIHHQNIIYLKKNTLYY